MRFLPRYSVLVLLLWFVGCADSSPQDQALLGPQPTPSPTPTPTPTPTPNPPPPPPPNPPPPSPPPGPSMAETMNRLITAYEQENLDSYRNMFTNDFSYEFSSNADPSLVQQFGDSWAKSDEATSARHLFRGYSPDNGPSLPAASSIDINLSQTTPSGSDTVVGVDPTTHKFFAARVNGAITISGSATT